MRANEYVIVAGFFAVFFVLPARADAIWEAAGRGDASAVALLVEKGTDVNARDDGGRTLLHHAVAHVKLGPQRIPDAEKGLPEGIHVFTMVRVGHMEVIRYLVTKGANVNAKDRVGTTPLHLAAWVNTPDVVGFLLDNGAKPHVKNSLDLTAMEYAKMRAGTGKSREKEMAGKIIGILEKAETATSTPAKEQAPAGGPVAESRRAVVLTKPSTLSLREDRDRLQDIKRLKARVREEAIKMGAVVLYGGLTVGKTTGITYVKSDYGPGATMRLMDKEMDLGPWVKALSCPHDPLTMESVIVELSDRKLSLFRAKSGTGAVLSADLKRICVFGFTPYSVGDKLVPIAEKADVRRKPTSESPSAFRVARDDTITVTALSGEWVQVRVENKGEGWIACGHVTLAPPPRSVPRHVASQASAEKFEDYLILSLCLINSSVAPQDFRKRCAEASLVLIDKFNLGNAKRKKVAEFEDDDLLSFDNKTRLFYLPLGEKWFDPLAAQVEMPAGSTQISFRNGEARLKLKGTRFKVELKNRTEARTGGQYFRLEGGKWVSFVPCSSGEFR